MTSSQSRWTHQPAPRVDRAAARRHLDEQTELLGKASLFQGLSKRHLRELAKVSGAHRCSEGQELVKEGANGSVFYLILDGTAKVVRGGRTVKRLGPGDFFGEMALLTTMPRSASVIAQTSMECVTLSAAHLRSVIVENPQIALRMMGTMADRIAELDRRLIN